jgi:peptidoglycan hydrolase CwlO-like protein
MPNRFVVLSATIAICLSALTTIELPALAQEVPKMQAVTESMLIEELTKHRDWEARARDLIEQVAGVTKQLGETNTRLKALQEGFDTMKADLDHTRQQLENAHAIIREHQELDARKHALPDAK